MRRGRRVEGVESCAAFLPWWRFWPGARSPDGAADEVRAGHQSQEREGAWLDDSPAALAPLGSGDPVILSVAPVLRFAGAPATGEILHSQVRLGRRGPAPRRPAAHTA